MAYDGFLSFRGVPIMFDQKMVASGHFASIIMNTLSLFFGRTHQKKPVWLNIRAA